MCEEERNWRRKHVLAAMPLFEEVISDQCQVELTGNQDVNLITEGAVLKMGEANEIRELYRALISKFRKPHMGKNCK